MRKPTSETSQTHGTFTQTSTTLALDTALHSEWVRHNLRMLIPLMIFELFQLRCRYTQLPPSSSVKDEPFDPSKVEMVTVPALGAEWGKDEMYQATKAGKRERKVESRKQFWKEWNRGQRGLCGHYFTRKVLVWVLFGLICV